VGLFLKQNLHCNFCSESNIYYNQNSATYATTLKGLKRSDIAVPEMKKL
jgi:hypothetical protein